MNAQTVAWLVFLALIKSMNIFTVHLVLTTFALRSCPLPDFSTCVFTTADCYQQVPFKLEDRNQTAKEGSCIEIKCTVLKPVYDNQAYWFWMKDAEWTGSNYSATIIYSTNSKLRPVSRDFVGRVKYNDGSSQKQCSILISNLNRTDSGNYSFRYIGKLKWATPTALNLTVTGKWFS